MDQEEDEDENVNDHFQEEEGIERVFARQVTASDIREAFLWRDPLMQ